MRNTIKILFLSFLLSASACESVLQVESGLPSRAGLTGQGDLYIFPNATLSGLPQQGLVSMDEPGLATIPLPERPLLVKNHNLHFDREENTVCGVFREPEETVLFYGCYDFATASIERITPPVYTYIDGVTSRDGQVMYQVVAISEYIEDSPWYYLVGIDLSSGEITQSIPVDAQTAFGSPQYAVLSADGRFVFIVTAPFERGTYRVELEKSYVLQTVDLEKGLIVAERMIPAFVSSSVLSEDGRFLLLYSNKETAVYAYDIAGDELSLLMPLERSSDLLYTVWLISTTRGVLVVDQSVDQTIVRTLAPDASSWETHSMDFKAYTVRDAGDGRIIFREYPMTLADFEQDPLPEKEETFHSVSLDSLTMMYSQRVQLPGEAFYTGFFYVLPANHNL